MRGLTQFQSFYETTCRKFIKNKTKQNKTNKQKKKKKKNMKRNCHKDFQVLWQRH